MLEALLTYCYSLRLPDELPDASADSLLSTAAFYQMDALVDLVDGA